ncbi:DUF4173 domain-containing protein [bacterium SCSIO 12741]|nr:DUF4173 domain-containing protein [bacterium SCSIO 12741]
MKRKVIGLLLGSLLFNYVFWGESLGINLFLFSLFLTLFAVPFRLVKTDRHVQVLALGALLTGFSVLFIHSTMSVVIHILSMVLLITFANQAGREILKSIWYAIPTLVHNLLLIPKNMRDGINHSQPEGIPAKGLLRFLKLSVFPLIVVAVFFILFRVANPIFYDFSTDFLDYVGAYLEHLYEVLSFPRIFFFLSGFTLVFWALYSQHSEKFAELESRMKNIIERIRPNRPKPVSTSQATTSSHPKHSFIALKNENRTARIMMVLVNLLLVAVNLIDIIWGWFGLEYKGDFDLTAYVHEGTYILIFSILLSMSLILYFYRRNQNFYPFQNQLKPLTYLWILQNAVLVISVAIRNLQYIHYYGLAYKRIGVFVFLTLVLFGLYTLVLKVKDRKSAYYLIRWNSWSIYAAFIAISLFNWDGIILRHNLKLAYPQNLDIEFLVSLSDKTLPLLDQNRQILDIENWQQPNNNFHYQLESRIQDFKERYESESWLSWNYQDMRAYHHFGAQTYH